MIQEKMSELKQKIIDYADYVEEMVRKSVESVTGRSK